MGGRVGGRPRLRIGRLAAVVIVVLIIALATRHFFRHHENPYEKLAMRITQAVQDDDMSHVSSAFNAQTRLQFTRERVGRASDALSPLGPIQRVTETTPAGSPDRTHYFTITGAHGTAHERLVLDPDGKVFSFDYRDVVPAGK